jgi:ribosomal protein L19E
MHSLPREHFNEIVEAVKQGIVATKDVESNLYGDIRKKRSKDAISYYTVFAILFTWCAALSSALYFQASTLATTTEKVSQAATKADVQQIVQQVFTNLLNKTKIFDGLQTNIQMK